MRQEAGTGPAATAERLEEALVLSAGYPVETEGRLVTDCMRATAQFVKTLRLWRAGPAREADASEPMGTSI